MHLSGLSDIIWAYEICFSQANEVRGFYSINNKMRFLFYSCITMLFFIIAGCAHYPVSEEPCGRDRRASKSKFKQPKLLNIFFSPLTSYVFLNYFFTPF
ncbi:MAG: hypothetical protein WA126_12265, partial [Thermodesulfovibrionales bacterium]